MTGKKEKILQSALELFASDGYRATSTSRIASHAGVSEGLIFRHFKNKEGLLEAILKAGEEEARNLFSKIIFETDPREVIRKTINLSSQIVSNREEADFWKLQYKIKWEVEQYGEHKMEPLEHALTNAFEKLGYEYPAHEARLLLIHLDGLATRYFLQANFDLDSMIEFMHSKYTE